MRTRRLWLAVAVLLALVVLARLLAPAAIAGALRRAAAERGLEARWDRFALRFPARAEFRRIALLERAQGDTLVFAESLAVALDPWALLTLHPRIESAEVAHARLRLAPRGAGQPDTLAPEPEAEADVAPRALKLRRNAESLAGLLLAPARRLPHLSLRDVVLAAPPSEESPLQGARIGWLSLDRGRTGIHLGAGGVLGLVREVPFEVGLAYGNDDRLAGGLLLGLPDTSGRGLQRLRVTVDGALHQDRHAGVLRLADWTRVTVGRLPIVLGGSLERRGPRLVFRLAADSLTEERITASLPRVVLGPLTRLAVHGSFDYRLALDLDLARPDSVRFEADVTPHGLWLDPAHSSLDIFGLDQPFTAHVHLPRGRIVDRELSPANPFYRPLESMDSLLVHAVLTNEDGGFYHHRGFNTEAIKLAIAANVKAGAYRRGAGTITMQLARNLWLGHERTLSRKAQEVVLAWVLEHLTGVSKRRLLEIYLNIIEWGPDVHGAAEATRYYFDEDPARVTVDEALFLATVVPAPTKWKYRFAADGSLREFERAQMRFIGRAMVAKGWLDPAMLPERDSLRVELRGPAREVLAPPAPAPADSLMLVDPGGLP